MASDDDLKARKRALRAEMRAARAALSGPERALRSAALLEHWKRERPVDPGAVVAGFLPMGEEVDIRPLMALLDAEGHEIALPAVVRRDAPLEFRRWKVGDQLDPGPMGTRHPPPTAEPLSPAVLLVPLLAFDAHGFRLGYGGGYYDRTLNALRAKRRVVAIGVGFELQRRTKVPTDPNDARLDWMLTERALYGYV